MLLGYVNIPQMFTFYTAYMDEIDYESGSMPAIHYCPACGQEFSARWAVMHNMGYTYTNDKEVFCPNCGTLHNRRGFRRDNKNVLCLGRKDTVPVNMLIKLEEFKYGLRLTASGAEITPDEMGSMLWYKKHYNETITFDINKRKTVLKKGSMEIELGNPFDPEFADNSNLRYLYGHTCINKYHSQMLDLLKKLRTGICKALTKKLNHNIGSMYRPYGSDNGPFIYSVINIAYRMICVDAPNLSNRYLHDYRKADNEAPIYCPADEKFFAKKFNCIRKAKDTISAFIEIAGLPDKRAFRRILAKEPLDWWLLSDIYKTFNQNIDDTVTIYNHCTEQKCNGYSYYYLDCKDILLNAAEISQYYSKDDVVKLFKSSVKTGVRHDPYILTDTARLLHYMSEKVKQKFNIVKPSIATAHDWLSAEQWKEEHKMIPFDIDNPLCRRLAMQSDRIKFFLPGTSFDLYTAGKKLKNCVGSYVDEVKNKETQIVLVSDDKGKLVVCIEVKNNKVEQAKLFANKCVSTDPLLNAEVIDWAEKAKIDWQGCSDIKQRDNYLMPLPAAV
ncbi:PcfJ domain-containing protein [Pectinatus frisingensis]|uniref:PcfJ domain-containing protein n=1 Tax=Pectinatus frisingensis TaxID=865 RepID=UPI0018C58643|nr:PcfJ domain-containing protein [Pectinatus frisingensis]